MTLEDKDKILQARAELETAQTNLLETYLSRIREHYQSLILREKVDVLDRLETLVSQLENRKSSAGKKNLGFDAGIARRIRKESGLSCSQLVEMLGFDKSSLTPIYRYENGQTRPSNPPTGKIAIKYINWLKEKGYNPFKL